MYHTGKKGGEVLETCPQLIRPIPSHTPAEGFFYSLIKP